MKEKCKSKKNCEEEGIFATGTDQITATTSLLRMPNTSLESISNSLISNFQEVGNTFLEKYAGLAQTDTNIAHDFRRSFFYERLLTVSTFILIVFIIRIYNNISFDKLKKAINCSSTAIEHHALLTRKKEPIEMISDQLKLSKNVNG